MLTSQLRHAFLAVSRAYFVPTYLVQEQPGAWTIHDTHKVVYQDRALVTKPNKHGHPCSSSSLPSIMAAMLEALDVPKGGCVLESGTGTGSNAALLAELVEPDGLVVSVDTDSQLIYTASTRLKALGCS